MKKMLDVIFLLCILGCLVGLLGMTSNNLHTVLIAALIFCGCVGLAFLMDKLKEALEGGETENEW